MIKKQTINLNSENYENSENYKNFYNTTPPITPKKYNYKFCKNCGKNNHSSYDCIEPIISNGIIGIYCEKINNLDINLDNLQNYLINNFKKLKFDINFNEKYSKFILNNIDKSNIKLLFIQRRNSIAYIEFMRGKYDKDNNENLINLFSKNILYIFVSHSIVIFLFMDLFDKSNNSLFLLIVILQFIFCFLIAKIAQKFNKNK